jgi:hypothetical protein
MVYKKYMVASTPFTGANDVYKWISDYFNLEQGLNKREFTLDNIKALAEKAGFPERNAPSIHVAGSKGKGSVTGMIAAILQSSGILTACYTSPHISDFRERLTIKGGFFSEEIYTSAGKELMEYVNALELETALEPSFFELITLWFFLCARRGDRPGGKTRRHEYSKPSSIGNYDHRTGTHRISGQYNNRNCRGKSGDYKTLAASGTRRTIK